MAVSAAGGAAGSGLPWTDILGGSLLGLGAFGLVDGILSRKKARKALKAREKRAQSYLDMGEIDAMRNSERIGADSRAGVQQSMIDRGLYNTTALDQGIGSVNANLAATQGNIRRDFAARKADLATQFAETPGDTGGGYQAMGSALGMLLASGGGADKTGVNAASQAKSPVSGPEGDETKTSAMYANPYETLAGRGGPATLSTATMTQAPAQAALMQNRARTRRRAAVGGYSGLMT